jgi:25S rRNA (uracil2634-N3)-methyltransferase
MDGLEGQMEGLSLYNKKMEKWIKHYSSCHKILLVGESDYSFAVCLAKAFGSATNIVVADLYPI